MQRHLLLQFDRVVHRLCKLFGPCFQKDLMQLAAHPRQALRAATEPPRQLNIRRTHLRFDIAAFYVGPTELRRQIHFRQSPWYSRNIGHRGGGHNYTFADGHYRTINNTIRSLTIGQILIWLGGGT